jgi:hypothetical protein
MQADFVLPSSRESILESRPWNKWLQQEVRQPDKDRHMLMLISQQPACSCLMA